MTRVFSDHCGPKGDKGDTGQPGPAGSPGLSVIGTPITSSIANAILFADGSGNLGQDAGFVVSFDVLDNPAPLGGLHGMAVQSSNAALSALTLMVSALNGLHGFFYAEAFGGGNAYVDLATDSAEWNAGVLSSSNEYRIGKTISGAASAQAFIANYTTLAVTLPSLAGTGTRTVVVDANGKLSAP